MTEQEVRDYVESAFQALKSRGWYADGTLVRAANTETDITAFETRRSLKLPRLYRAYLQSWRRMVPQPDSGEQWDKEYQDLIRSTHDSFRLNALFQEEGDFGALWLELHCPPEAHGGTGRENREPEGEPGGAERAFAGGELPVSGPHWGVGGGLGAALSGFEPAGGAGGPGGRLHLVFGVVRP